MDYVERSDGKFLDTGKSIGVFLGIEGRVNERKMSSEGTRNVNDFLATIVGKKVWVKLNSGVHYKGEWVE